MSSISCLFWLRFFLGQDSLHQALNSFFPLKQARCLGELRGFDMFWPPALLSSLLGPQGVQFHVRVRDGRTLEVLGLDRSPVTFRADSSMGQVEAGPPWQKQVSQVRQVRQAVRQQEAVLGSSRQYANVVNDGACSLVLPDLFASNMFVMCHYTTVCSLNFFDVPHFLEAGPTCGNFLVSARYLLAARYCIRRSMVWTWKCLCWGKPWFWLGAPWPSEDSWNHLGFKVWQWWQQVLSLPFSSSWYGCSLWGHGCFVSTWRLHVPTGLKESLVICIGDRRAQHEFQGKFWNASTQCHALALSKVPALLDVWCGPLQAQNPNCLLFFSWPKMPVDRNELC